MLDFENNSLICLCYAKEDFDKVISLYEKLKKEGFNLWSDLAIKPGQNKMTETNNAIKKSAVVLLCLSKASLEKDGDIHKMIIWALESKKGKRKDSIFIIPIKLDNCELPDDLSELTPCDLFNSEDFAKLVNAIQFKIGTYIFTNSQKYYRYLRYLKNNIKSYFTEAPKLVTLYGHPIIKRESIEYLSENLGDDYILLVVSLAEFISNDNNLNYIAYDLASQFKNKFQKWNDKELKELDEMCAVLKDKNKKNELKEAFNECWKNMINKIGEKNPIIIFNEIGDLLNIREKETYPDIIDFIKFVFKAKKGLFILAAPPCIKKYGESDADFLHLLNSGVCLNPCGIK